MRLPILFLVATVMLDSIGIGLIIPVMPDLIEEVRGIDVARAALWGGALSAIFAVIQFLFSPALGNLSDRFGRRPVLLISLAVMALDYVLMAVAGTIWLLVLGRVIGGITAATHSTASAAMADLSEPEKKAQNFGLISAAFGMGFVIGPIIGGLLAEFGTRAPFYAAALVALINLALGYFVLPETVSKAARRPFRWARANPLGGLAQISALPGLQRLLGVYFFYQIANMVYPAVWSYFTIAAFDWDPGMIGLSLTLYGITTAISQALLIRYIIGALGEARTVWVGLLFNVATLGAVGLAPTGGLVLALIPLAALGGVVAPALQGIMSQRAGQDQQGELQGLLASINALGMILTPLVMTQVFFWFTRDGAEPFMPGAPFLLAMLMMAIAWGIYGRVGRRRPAPGAAGKE